MEYEHGSFLENRTFYFAVFLIVLLIVASFIATYNLISNVDDKITENNQIKQVISQKNEKTYYKVKDTDGKIGVYENDELKYVLSVYTFTLHPNDQKLLSVGIITDDEEELIKILENYN